MRFFEMGTLPRVSRLSGVFLAVLVFCCALAWDGAESAPEPLLANQPLGEYKARRQRVLEQIREGLVVLGGAHENDFGEAGRFRQNNYFQYLTGVETPGAYLVLAPKGMAEFSGAREVLFIPPRNPGAERWTGRQPEPGAEAERLFGFERVMLATELDRLIRKQVEAGAKQIHTLTPARSDTPRVRELLLADHLRLLT
ncbi:MAG: aminopeptidase P N-terminal domain-containing protein, partial [Blastocatellia bacterium]